jgi:AhpD family alkylhydroperoxidase
MEFDDLQDFAGRKTVVIGTKTPWFVLNSPELGKPFAEFYESCKNTGVLDKKTKELLMTALACVFRCPDCLEEHIKSALKAGATKEEITEALLIAAVEGADSQLAWNKDLYLKYLT